MTDKKRQSTIRIAAFEYWPGAYRGWPKVRFEVEHRFSDTPPVIVNSPEEARHVAERMAAACHGRIYRGWLPRAWHEALSEYPRS